MIVYEILMERDQETSLLYKEWTVPAGLPLQHNFITKPIPEELNKAKYDYRQEKWVEDTELIEQSKVEELETELSNTKERLIGLEDAFLELMITTTNMGGEQ